ncbi:hypothetical protein [Arenibaculum pallidiluteum]|uniref:hypothetical protein n=1 Tax=Arenibaculum pallidiluteum TaxID=2812559 RepID=UPI001A9710FE|nr:hypothetical protein [Arenibaculum pallidiluteum]
MAVIDVAQRQKIIDGLLRKAEDLLRSMRNGAMTEPPEGIEARALALAELMKAPEFPPQRASEFREQAKIFQRNAFQRSVDAQLSLAEQAARAGDDKKRNEILAKAREHFGKAVRFGVDDEFRGAVERRVQAIMLTSAGGVDQRTKDAAARKLETQDAATKAPAGRERRGAIRYFDPPLTVVLDGRSYHTVNWSIRGLLIEDFRNDQGLRVGDKVRLDLSCEFSPDPVRQPAVVARVGNPDGTLALAFPAISTAVLGFAHAMKGAGVQAAPER